MSVGVAAGAGEGGGSDPAKGQGQGSGGGGGGGANVTPIGFITYDGKDIRFIAIGKGKLDALIETVPELIKKIGLAKSSKGKGTEE
ncbi:MAG: hypothetical protein FJY65_12690 [Calditrichaeota bacterium]|nr:hypothetical protein [Calditrichota bacterium]